LIGEPIRAAAFCARNGRNENATGLQAGGVFRKMTTVADGLYPDPAGFGAEISRL